MPVSITRFIASNATSSSSPSQLNSITSPHLTQAPKTLKTLFAFALLPFVPNVISDLNLIASLQKIPAERRCSPFGLVIVIVNALLVFASRRVWSGIIMLLISIVLSAGMVYGLDVLTSVEKAIEEITLDEEEEPQVITEMGIVVLSDSNIHQINDLSEFVIGYIKDTDYEYTKELMGEIDKAIGGAANYVEFSSMATMAEALYAKTADALIINKAYIDMKRKEGNEQWGIGKGDCANAPVCFGLQFAWFSWRRRFSWALR